MASLIDTHAHLTDTKFGDDLPAILARARHADVTTIIAVGICAASSTESVTLARHYPEIYATVGIHPNSAAEAHPNDWDTILALLDDPRVVGIGETGLDRHWDFTPFDVQEEYFARHLSLSREKKLPVIIHSRDCDADMLRVLRAEYDRAGPIHAVMHSFCGDIPMAEACLDMGLHISFAGMLTYKNAADLRAVAATIPPDRVFVETDCPYLSPVPKRGKRNEPAHVVHTAACLAEQLGMSAEQLAEQTTTNAKRFFGLE